MKPSATRLEAEAFSGSLIVPAQANIRRVALGGDSLVPVVIGRGRVLDLDVFEPGILARRLIEVTVDANETLVHIKDD